MANKILLIEDDSGITMALTDLLNAEDYSVETAADGLTGLARAREGNFDVIILDVMLPGKNGFDVCCDAPKCIRAKVFFTNVDFDSRRSTYC